MDAHDTSFNHNECWVCVRWGGDCVGSCVCVGGRDGCGQLCV
jgi:hypothetical protein